MSIIPIQFSSDKSSITCQKELWQWDTGHKIQISGLNIEGKTVYVNFSFDKNTGEAPPVETVLVDGKVEAKIPAFIFEKEDCCVTSSYKAYAFVRVIDEESMETIFRIAFIIKTQPKPNDYIHTEDELRSFDALEKHVEEELTEFRNQLAAVPKYDPQPVDALPTEDISTTTLYLLKNGEKKGNLYEEYIYVNGAWEHIGSAEMDVDLSNFVGKVAVASGKYLYGADKDGERQFKISEYGDGDTIVIRDGYGGVRIAETPRVDAHATSKKYVDEGFVHQVTYSQTNTMPNGTDGGVAGRVYVVDKDGKQNSALLHTQSFEFTIPVRDAFKNFYVATPVLEPHCANKGYVDNNFVAKPTDTSGYNRAYCVNTSNNPLLLPIQIPSYHYEDESKSSRYGLAQYVDGNLGCSTPTSEYHTANKKYVDEKIKDWRYIGKVTTEEDVVKFSMSADENGNPFSLKKIRVVFKNMPNSGDLTGWVRIYINDGAWKTQNVGNGVKTTEKYCASDFEIEKIGGHLRTNTIWRSLNVTTAPEIMSPPNTATSGAYTFEDTSFDGTINKIEITSYQLAIGAGSYFEVWGIDA